MLPKSSPFLKYLSLGKCRDQKSILCVCGRGGGGHSANSHARMFHFQKLFVVRRLLQLDNLYPCGILFCRSRVRTTGIVETEFEIQGNRFRMLDVRFAFHSVLLCPYFIVEQRCWVQSKSVVHKCFRKQQYGYLVADCMFCCVWTCSIVCVL